MANADDVLNNILSSGSVPMSDPDTAFERSAPPSARIERDEFPVTNPPPELAAIGKYMLDFGRVAVDEAAYGTMRPINAMTFGTGYAALDLLSGYKGDTGDKGPLGVIGEAYGRAYNEIDERLDDSVDNLGVPGNIGASLVGSLSPFGAARAIDKGIDATLSLPHLIRKGGSLGRAARSALVGGSSAALQSYFQGNTSMEDMVMSGAFGAGMSGLMQKLFGDRALPAIMNMRNAEGELVTALSDVGPGVSRNLNLGALADAVEEGKFTNKGWLTAEIGNSPLYRQWEKLNDAMAEYSFEGVKPGKLDDQAIAIAEDKFAAAHNAINGAIDVVNRDARETFSAALDNPAGRKAALYENNQLLRDAREIYRRMGSTAEPDSLGNKPFNPKELVDMADSALFGDLGRQDVTELPPSMIKMRNAFKDLIRGREVEEVAQGLRNVPSSGVKNPRADEIFPDELPLFRLMDARAKLSDMISPAMAFKNGTSRAELKAGKVILNEIDRYLDIETNNGYGLARGAFSKAMKVEEAFDLGKKIYDQRHIEVKDKDSFGSFYGEYVSDLIDDLEISNDKEVLAAFRDGFKQGMFDQTGRRGFLEEMQYFVGPSDTAGNTFFKGKGENYNLMVKILGEDDAKTVMQLYRDGGHQEKAMSLFRDNLEAVGFDKDAAFKLSNTLNEANVFEESLNAPPYLIGAAKSFMRKVLKPSDRKMGEAALDLLTAEGPELEAMLTKGIKSAVGGVPMSVGATVGSMADINMFRETTGDKAERERQEAEQAAQTEQLKEYFKGIGISP